MEEVEESNISTAAPVEQAQVVWLTEWRTYGILLQESAHTSTVTFLNPRNKERLTEEIENDEYEYWKDHAIDYDKD